MVKSETEGLFFKKADEKDVDLLFNWINEPEVRDQSLSTEKIAYEDHVQWFSKKIADPDCHLYIAYINDSPVGMIRFDITNNTATINYLVDKSQRGKGIGGAIVENGLKKFSLDSGFNGNICAVVKISNPASIKIFERLEFQKESEDSMLIHFKKLV